MSTKIFIASPAFDGKTHVPFAISLAETTLLLAMNNIGVEYRITTSGSLLCAERNRLIQAFLKSDSTHMLCIDSDLGWPAAAVLGLLSKDVDFVAGVYPSRRDNIFMFRPAVQENGSIIVDADKGLLQMEYIPAGFMLLTRAAVEKMIVAFPDLQFTPKDPNAEPGVALFNTEIWNGEFWGEDYVFCRRARECGINIWVDPQIEFDHAGVRGMLTQVLTNEKPA